MRGLQNLPTIQDPKKFREKVRLLLGITAREKRAFRALASKGLLPLDYLLGVMQDPRQPQEERMRAAAICIPYVHPRLAILQVHSPNMPGMLTLEDLVLATIPNDNQPKMIEARGEVEDAETIDDLMPDAAE